MTTQELLNERGKTHGDWQTQAKLTYALKSLLSGMLSSRAISAAQSEALSMICTKLARIAVGDANYVDHWRDIAGYAELVVQELQAQNAVPEKETSYQEKPWPGRLS